MTNEHDPGKISLLFKGPDLCALPDYPGEDALLHEGMRWIETAERQLAAMGLLEVANGGEPTDAASLRDLPVPPLLAESHMDCERRKEDRVRVIHANDVTMIKRFLFTMRDWSTLYAVVTKSMEKTAPRVAHELHEACSLRSRGVGADDHFDGPLAWRVAKRLLERLPADRKKHDKVFQGAAEKPKAEDESPADCAADVVARKAVASVRNASFDLVRSFTFEGEDADVVDLLR